MTHGLQCQAGALEMACDLRMPGVKCGLIQMGVGLGYFSMQQAAMRHAQSTEGGLAKQVVSEIEGIR
jgi:hypothetical protein